MPPPTSGPLSPNPFAFSGNTTQKGGKLSRIAVVVSLAVVCFVVSGWDFRCIGLMQRMKKNQQPKKRIIEKY